MHKPGNPLIIMISGINHPTESIAELAEAELSEGVQQQTTYLKDTTDFLRKLNQFGQTLPPDRILFTLDVKNLYRSVPKNERLAACKTSLEKRTNQKIPTDKAMEIIELVLDNNIFLFNNTHYIQKDGTAIGSRLGRSYPGTFMG